MKSKAEGQCLQILREDQDRAARHMPTFQLPPFTKAHSQKNPILFLQIFNMLPNQGDYNESSIKTWPQLGRKKDQEA